MTPSEDKAIAQNLKNPAAALGILVAGTLLRVLSG